MIDRGLVRGRHWAGRRRRWYWPTVATLGLLTLVGIGQRSADLERQRGRWGDTTTVWAATAPLEPGDPISGRVKAMEFPVALAPTERWTGDDGVARQYVDTGTILMVADMVEGNDALALVPAGSVALAVAEAQRSGAKIGDHVGVYSAGVNIVDKAVVVGTSDESTVIAVPADAAGAVSVANENRSITLARIPPASNP